MVGERLQPPPPTRSGIMIIKGKTRQHAGKEGFTVPKNYKLRKILARRGASSSMLQIPGELADNIAETAREGYQSEGRGLVITAVDVEQGDEDEEYIEDASRVSVNEFYIPVEKLRHIRQAIPFLSDNEYEEVIQMVKAYNPITHFVVLLSMGDNVVWYKGEHHIHFALTA